MAMNIFDLKAGNSQDGPAQAAKSAKPTKTLNPARQADGQRAPGDFKKVLDRIQQQTETTSVVQPTAEHARTDDATVAATAPDIELSEMVEQPSDEVTVAEQTVVEQMVAIPLETPVSQEVAPPPQAQPMVPTDANVIPTAAVDVEGQVVQPVHVAQVVQEVQDTQDVQAMQAELQAILAVILAKEPAIAEQLRAILASVQDGKPLDLQQLEQLYQKLLKFVRENAQLLASLKSSLDGQAYEATDMKDVKPQQLTTLLQMLQQLIDAKPLDSKQNDFLQTLQSQLSNLLSKVAPTQAGEFQQPSNDSGDSQQTHAPNQAKPTVDSSVATVPQQPVTTATQTNKVPVTGTVPPQQLPQEMKEMLTKNFKVTQNNIMSEARFKLNPENLGHVNVKITVTNGTVVAQLFTDTAVAREALEAQLSQLRAALQSTGLTVEKLEVQHHSLLSQQFHEQRKQNPYQNFNKSSKQKAVKYVEVDQEVNELLEKVKTQSLRVGTSFDVTA
jgi:flagellar hook-length control protein FliK